MRSDIIACKEAGAAGVVVGALTADGGVDEETMKLLVDGARPMTVTFHRAIDVCNDPIKAVQVCKSTTWYALIATLIQLFPETLFVWRFAYRSAVSLALIEFYLQVG
jgi:hypothetical protein